MGESETPSLRDAIAVTCGDDDGPAFVTKYVVIAEATTQDGETSLHTISDCEHAYQVLGMLRHAELVAFSEKYLDRGDG